MVEIRPCDCVVCEVEYVGADSLVSVLLARFWFSIREQNMAI